MNYFKNLSHRCPPAWQPASPRWASGTCKPKRRPREFKVEGNLLSDRVAAVVNDGVVLESEVDDQLAYGQGSACVPRDQQMPRMRLIRQQIVEHLVVEEGRDAARRSRRSEDLR